MPNLSDLLSQSVDMTLELIKTKQRATIDIRIGSEFKFHFCSQEDEIFARKKLSLSQRKRDSLRKSEFEHLKQVERTNDDGIKMEIDNQEGIVNKKDSEAQTDTEEAIGKKDT